MAAIVKESKAHTHAKNLYMKKRFNGTDCDTKLQYNYNHMVHLFRITEFIYILGLQQ